MASNGIIYDTRRLRDLILGSDYTLKGFAEEVKKRSKSKASVASIITHLDGRYTISDHKEIEAIAEIVGCPTVFIEQIFKKTIPVSEREKGVRDLIRKEQEDEKEAKLQGKVKKETKPKSSSTKKTEAKKVFDINKLMQVMKEKGFSEYALRKRIDISNGSFSNWKNGSIPRDATIDKICKALGITRNEIFSEVNEQKKASDKRIELSTDVDFNVRVTKGSEVVLETHPELSGKTKKVRDLSPGAYAGKVSPNKKETKKEPSKYQTFDSTNSNNIMARFDVINSNILLLADQMEAITDSIVDIASVVKPSFGGAYETLNMHKQMQEVKSTVIKVEDKIDKAIAADNLVKIAETIKTMSESYKELNKSFTKQVKGMESSIKELSDKVDALQAKQPSVVIKKQVKEREEKKPVEKKETNQKPESKKKAESEKIKEQEEKENKIATALEIRQLCNEYDYSDPYPEYRNKVYRMCRLIQYKTNRSVRSTLHEYYEVMKNTYGWVSSQSAKEYKNVYGSKASCTLELIYFASSKENPFADIFYNEIASALQCAYKE